MCYRYSQLMIVASMLVLPLPAHAQNCFRGRPTPYCNSFLITESSITAELSSNGDEDIYALAEIGKMKNLSERWAAGVTVIAGFHTEYNLYVSLGIKPRVRRWITPYLSADVGVGFLILPSPGFTSSLSLNLADVVAVVARFEFYDVEKATRIFYVENYGKKDARLYLGARLGSYPGTAGLAVGLGVLGFYAAWALGG